MAGLPWYCLWTEFPRHEKTLALCARIRDDNAGMYVIRLFSHCAERALDGLIPPDIVEGVGGWRKRRGVLLEALIAVGTLEPREGGALYLHGWEERNGSRIRKTLADAAKPRGNKPRSRCGPDVVPSGTSAGVRGVDVRSDTEEDTEEETEATAACLEPAEAPASEPLPGLPGSPEPRKDPPVESKQPALKSAPVADSRVRGLQAGASPEAPSPRAGAAPTSARGAESPTLDPPRASTTPLARSLSCDPPRSPPGVVDAPGTHASARWPLVEPFRSTLANRLVMPPGYLRVAAPDNVETARNLIESELERLGGADALPRAVEIAAEACFREVKAGRKKPRYLYWYLGCLQDAPSADPPAAVRVAEADPGCVEWDNARALLRERLRPDLYDRWFAPLGEASVNGQVLTVKAPDKYHRDFVVDNYGDWLPNMVAESGHAGLRLEVMA